jgi:hypothetical protein
MRTPIAATLAGLLLLGQAVAAPPTPEARYQAATTELKEYCGDLCDLGLDNDPAEVKALDALWDATQDWTLAFLASHPGITVDRLKAKLAIRHPEEFKAARISPARVTLLAPDLYAFSAYWGVTGDVFLVGRRDGQWAVVWDVRKAETARFAALKAWRTDHAGAGCHDEEGHDGRYDCGPLYGTAFALKPDAQGRVRFGLSGTYAQGAGFTLTSQISFWRWDGARAEPLLAETYHHEEDDIARGRDTTETVVVRVKQDYRSFEACGACEGRQFDWNFRVRPDGIVDAGKKLVHPEADFIDQVYDRLEAATDAAPPAVLALMTANIPSRGDFITSRNEVCLFSDAFDEFDLIFHVVRRPGGYFIDRVNKRPRREGAEVCRQPRVK